MDHSHYLHVNVHVSWEWNPQTRQKGVTVGTWYSHRKVERGFRSPGKTILVAIESTRQGARVLRQKWRIWHVCCWACHFRTAYSWFRQCGRHRLRTWRHEAEIHDQGSAEHQRGKALYEQRKWIGTEPNLVQPLSLQARSQGGFGGCGRTPLFLGPTKKKFDATMVSAFGSCVFRCDLACTSVGQRIHGPEPNLESVHCVADVDERQTIGPDDSFDCPLSTSSVVFCVDWKGLRLKFTNEPSVLKLRIWLSR